MIKWWISLSVVICSFIIPEKAGCQMVQEVVLQRKDNTDELIKWVSFEEAVDMLQKDKKKVFLEVYTRWCGWCKQMDEITLKDPRIAQYINENYYPVKFDAESKKQIKFKEKMYEFIMRPGMGGYHALADEFLDGKLMFPTMVFLDEDMNLIQAIAGFQIPDEFERIITYFATDHYKKMPWATYKVRYKSILETSKE